MRLRALEDELETSCLLNEDTLRRTLTDVERAHLRNHRAFIAAHWNLLTGLRVEDLPWLNAGVPAAEPPV